MTHSFFRPRVKDLPPELQEQILTCLANGNFEQAKTLRDRFQQESSLPLSYPQNAVDTTTAAILAKR